VTLLVTGGCGLVGAHVVRRFLLDDPARRAIVVDVSAPDAAARAWFAPVADRIGFVRADLATPAALDVLPDPTAVTHVVHAATVTGFAAWERERPRRYLDVNIGGTVNVLELARSLPNLRRLVSISSGSVYGPPGPGSPEGPQPEAGPVRPRELYAISKEVGERIAARYAELFGLDLRIARLSGIFGPLERPTVGRIGMSTLHVLASAHLAGRPLRLSERSLRAGGDFLSAEDAAVGLVALTLRPGLRHDLYNLAYGTFTSGEELAAAAAGAGVPVEVVGDGEDADIDLDPANRLARYNAYDITRARRDLDFAPRPLVEQIRSYLDWVSGSAAPI
jgi:nucleoside-diphosphate-sugar epimerase